MKKLKFKIIETITVANVEELQQDTIEAGTVIEIDETNYWELATENPIKYNGVEYWVKTSNLKEVTKADEARKITSAALSFIIFLISSTACLYYGLSKGSTVFCVMGLISVFITLHQLYLLKNAVKPQGETEKQKAPAQTPPPYDIFNTINKVETKTESKFKKSIKFLKPFLIGIFIKLFKKLPDVAILWALLKLFNLLK